MNRNDAQQRPKLLRTKAVAEALDVEPQTVVLWIKAGRVTAKKTPGGQYRIAQSELDRLLADLEQPTDEDPEQHRIGA